VGNPQVLKVGTETGNASLSSLASAYPASTACRVINNWSRTQKTREREFRGELEKATPFEN
jgi:hypothetical protein